MPWLIVHNNNEFCIHMKNADGSAGDMVACHESEDAAKQQLAALYANEPDAETNAESDSTERITITELREHPMRGSFPQIENYSFVDTALLTEGDSKPLYVVLEIANVGEISRNNLLYDDELVSAIEQQLRGLGGIRGHLRDDERDSAFPLDAVDWVGHKREGTKLFAKGYIPPGDDRDNARRIKARGGALTTSLYGTGTRVAMENMGSGVYRLKNFVLEQLDLVPPSRAGRVTNGEFLIVNEMVHHEESTVDKQELKTALAALSAAEVAELLSDTTVEAVATEYAKKANKKLVGESDKTDKDIITELNTATTRDQRTIAELRDTVRKYQQAEFETGLTALVDGKVSWETPDQKSKDTLAALRKNVRVAVMAELGSSTDLKDAERSFEKVWETGGYKLIAETMKSGLMGPAAITGGAGDDKTVTKEKVVELASATLKDMGF